MRPVADSSSLFFFFNDTATTEIYTLSLHDALPISCSRDGVIVRSCGSPKAKVAVNVRRHNRSSDLTADVNGDRKSTRLNSSHGYISYAVFCLKKKKNFESKLVTDCITNSDSTSHDA